MDSEDEHELTRDELTPNFYERFWKRNGLELRRFEKKEARAHKRLPRPSAVEAISRYRMLRFFATVEGFHKGSLDLSGRHENRYKSLYERWAEFSVGVALALRGSPDDPYNSDMDTRARTYLASWNVQDAMTPIELMQKIVPIFETILSNPKPKFQAIVLLDLPPEILHIIMDNDNGDTSWSLRATCRTLHAIARPYIFKTCTLRLDRPLREFEGIGIEPVPNFGEILEHSRRAFLQRAKTLQTHPDVQKYTQRLTLSVQTVASRLNRYQTVFIPVYKAICDTLPHLSSLRILVLKKINLTTMLLEQLRQLHFLHTLEIKSCVSDVPYTPQLCQLSSILNLLLDIDDIELTSSLITLAMFPRIKNLSVQRSDSWSPRPFADLAPPQFWHEVNPFMTLRKLLFPYPCSSSTFATLMTWMEAALTRCSQRCLPLTHLKIILDTSVTGAKLIDFLRLLAKTSLESLVIVGIPNPRPTFFSTISELLPNLLELTLTYVPHDDDFMEIDFEAFSLSNWPFSPYNYARSFSSFNRLSYFAWNIKYPKRTYYTSSLLLLEEEDSAIPDEDFQLDDALDEGAFLARSFWAYCPSLQYMVITDTRPRYIYRRIDVDGHVSFKNTKEAKGMVFRCNPQKQWDRS